MHRVTWATLIAVAIAANAKAADWPMFRADAARSGYTQEQLPNQLRPRWVYRANHPPRPAWPTRNRLAFDRAIQVVIAGETLYFGSSVDTKVYALDVTSGDVRWTFFTDGPVRFAPVVWRDRLLVASDDGYLYCLFAETGRLIWKRRGGPRSDMLLGNDRMISRWPARGGPVVMDNVVYFGAGIWPSEGIFLHALDADSGQVLWQNDSSGSIEMDQPHGTARAKSGLSAQGYLAACDDRLLVPTGRAVPAVLNTSDGTLRHFQLQANQHAGGADVVAIDDYFANSGVLYATSNASRVGKIGLRVAVHPEYVITTIGNRLVGLPRQQLVIEKETVDRKGNKQRVKELAKRAWEAVVAFDATPPPPIPEDRKPPEVRMSSTAWTSPVLEGEAAALIVAADQAIIGGRGRVSIVDIASRELAWSADVEGTAYDLAVANGKLYVSTDAGATYCFDDNDIETPHDVSPRYSMPPVEDDLPSAIVAQGILERTEIRDGYCVDLRCGDGQLALELARRSNLQIYATDPDAANLRKARQRLDRAGLYGARVTVHLFDSTDVPYADYCADLVVSGDSVREAPRAEWFETAERLQRPSGGVICVGRADAAQVSVRGPLDGGGSWRHQNASPANTLCSDDRRVRGPLEMLWFRDTDFLMANRHGRAPTALVEDGRMFVEGLNGLRAQSIYNGRVLWEFSAPGILSAYHREHSIGAAWTGGNICLGAGRVYLHNDQACLVLDAATGRKISRFSPPSRPDGKVGVWGYLAFEDEILFGSLANEDYLIKCWSDRWDTGRQFTESDLFFALDAKTGRQLWSFNPEHSIRHNAIAIADGRVYLIDRPVSAQDQIVSSAVVSLAVRRGDAAEAEQLEHPTGRLIALDAQSGRMVWESREDVFGTLLACPADSNLLWMGYQAAHQASRDSELANRMAVFKTVDGSRVWDVQAEYADRPVLNGRTIYAPPGAWDLSTGNKLPLQLDRSYGCGIVAGCQSMLVFRSATLGYIDLATSMETQNYGGIRPGCWIAGIPAGGVLVMPDAASWCTCSYLNQGTLVLRPAADRHHR